MPFGVLAADTAVPYRASPSVMSASKNGEDLRGALDLAAHCDGRACHESEHFRRLSLGGVSLGLCGVGDAWSELGSLERRLRVAYHELDLDLELYGAAVDAVHCHERGGGQVHILRAELGTAPGLGGLTIETGSRCCILYVAGSHLSQM